MASADDLIPSIVFILCQAKLEFPFSIERYIEIFGDKDSQINQEAQQRVLFYSAHHFIKDLTHKELEMTEEEFDSAVAARSPTVCKGYGI